MPKGGVLIGDHILFGKYRLCRKLGSGQSGSVYLALHVELEEYRAIKIVSKTSMKYESFRKEALILKTLRHPGIPIVYDVEEDPQNSYLIEEYLEGESLYALVKRLGTLSLEMAVSFGIQICQLIQFMYSAENPILYLDLQPKNLIVCSGKIKLIDFNHAQFAEEAQETGERYGTVGFAAPEQYNGGTLDCRSDIYSLGALLYFMCRGRPAKAEPEFPTDSSPKGIQRIITICMAEKQSERFQTPEGLLEALVAFQEDMFKKQAVQSRKVVFAGSRPGIGTTHAALGLSSFLTRNGYLTLYQEGYNTDTIRCLAKNQNAKQDPSGIIHLGCTSIRPYYGETVQMPYPYYPIVVIDSGASLKDMEQFSSADFIVLVCGGKWWEIDSTAEAARQLCRFDKVLLLFNHMADSFSIRLPEDIKALPCLQLPFFPNPFSDNRLAGACYEELCRLGLGGETEWKKRKRGFFRRKKQVWRKRPD